jgi:hypothetical protein
MPKAVRLLKSMQRLGSAPRRSTRARLVRISYDPTYRPPPRPIAGLNGPESEVYNALVELRVNFSAQASFLGGSVTGGARADFLLYDVRKVLLFDGPFHLTTYGLSRDILTDITYRSSGFEPVHMHTSDLANLKPYLLGVMGRPV